MIQRYDSKFKSLQSRDFKYTIVRIYDFGDSKQIREEVAWRSGRMLIRRLIHEME